MDHETLMKKRAEALGGQSPRARGAEKQAAALRWLYRWGWSSPTTTDLVASPNRRGVARRLIEKGLADEHHSPAGSGVRGAPASVLTLTDDGRAEVEAVIDEGGLLRYQGAKAIRWPQLRHDALVQRATARAMNDGSITGYQTPAEIAERSDAGTKHPDAVWHVESGEAWAIELELTAKWDRRLDQFALGLLGAIAKRGPYDRAVILSHSPALLQRYRTALKPGATLHRWEKDSRGHWHRQNNPGTVPTWAGDRVIFRKVDLA